MCGLGNACSRLARSRAARRAACFAQRLSSSGRKFSECATPPIARKTYQRPPEQHPLRLRCHDHNNICSASTPKTQTCTSHHGGAAIESKNQVGCKSSPGNSCEKNGQLRALAAESPAHQRMWIQTIQTAPFCVHRQWVIPLIVHLHLRLKFCALDTWMSALLQAEHLSLVLLSMTTFALLARGQCSSMQHTIDSGPSGGRRGR